MTNIEKIRVDIKKAFSENVFQKGEHETIISPSKQFRLETTNYWSKDPNWDVTQVIIYDHNEKLFDFFVNDSNFFFGWLTSNNQEYLICAEDIFGGQTIVDLTDRKMSSYSPGMDGFIWTDFHLSPDGKTLATIGCFWACPYVIKLFDFSNPFILPLEEIKEIELLGNDEIISVWLDNETLKMKGIKREQVPEYDSNGGFRMITLSETEVERELIIKS